MKAVFVDANPALSAVADKLYRPGKFELAVNRNPDIKPADLPGLLKGASVAIVDHTSVPTDLARTMPGLKHIVFLGTGARSYMNPEELGALGIGVHTIKGYGDTAVAECAFGLMFAAAKGVARMDGGMRAGQWLRTDGVQLTGKTVGLLGYGGIAAEFARLARGIGMRVIAWNRTKRAAEGVEFVELSQLLMQSDVLSIHLLLTDETRGFLNRERIAAMRKGAILINTARGAIVDETAMIEALGAGQLRHAGLDVFEIEPLPAGHRLTKVENVTLSAHSAFRTPEANENLIGAAFAHCERIAAG